MSCKIALYYDQGGYAETLKRTKDPRHGQPIGLMGRQVASNQFLNAYLTHGGWSELVALAPTQDAIESLKRTCVTHLSSRAKRRRLQSYQLANFCDSFLSEPPARLIHFPCPPEPRFVWARQHFRQCPYAVCGVTHTLCSERAIEMLRSLVTAPYEPFDRLICTSRAVREMVQAAVGSFAEYLQSRFGGHPQSRIGLETIPLGVDTEAFRPATPERRAEERMRLDVADDEIVALFVGRLSHHSKAHPFPMFRSLAEAAARTGRKVHLLLSGWAASDTLPDRFRDGAKRFAPNVRCTIVDGMAPENRFNVWRAADMFVSFSDNIQETFGLVVVEAMACGLPVVATDWDGYRDLVINGETGFLVPTAMVRNATSDLTVRLLVGEISYDQFLARASQSVAVDVAAASDAFSRLLENGELRQRMGAAGRQVATERFDWQHVIRAYERIWNDQQSELDVSNSLSPSVSPHLKMAAYPPPESCFAGYPTNWLDGNHWVQATSNAIDSVDVFQSLPLTNHEPDNRCHDLRALRLAVERATDGCRLEDLSALLRDSGVSECAALATVAWLMKYDLLRAIDQSALAREDGECEA